MKIVFFHSVKQTIGGSLLQYANLAMELAENSDNEVYYIDNINSAVTPMMENSSAVYADVQTFDYSKLEGAVFITPPNYIIILADKIRNLKNAKILTYNWHYDCFNYLDNQIISTKYDCKTIFKTIAEKHAMCFMDEGAYIAAVNTSGVNYEKKIVPIIKQIDSDKTGNVNEACKDRIRIGWLGRLDTDKINSIINIAERILAWDLDECIDFHIIGDGNAKNRINTARYAGKIRFIFNSYLLKDEMYQYLYENVDVLFAMGTAAINGAEVGIPTAIVAASSQCFYSDKFVFIYDTKYNTLGWRHEDIDALGYKTYTFKEIIDLSRRNKKEIGTKCFEHVKNNHLEEYARNSIMKCIQETELTINDVLHMPGINETIEAYQKFKSETGEEYEGFSRKVREIRYYENEGKYTKIKRILIDKIIDKFLLWAQKVYTEKKRVKEFYRVQKNYEEVLSKIKQKMKSGEKIKVGFFTISDASFPSENLFLQMREDDRFEAQIVVVPDYQRDIRYRVQTYQNSKKALSEKYHKYVIDGYDVLGDVYHEFSDEYDIVCFNNPYERMAHPFHHVKYFLDKEVLTMYVNYGFFTVKFGRNIVNQDFYNLVWKVFIDSEQNMLDLKKTEPIKGKNGVVVGYMQMDDLANVEKERRTRKRIMICPHHTVMGWNALDISNFLKYSDFILELPKMYPGIDFVFRPHMLLFNNLISGNIWSQKQLDKYLEEIDNLPNMVYDCSGDYREVFANSDAMIHDCASFTAEYLFTENPCCYMLKDEKQIEDVFLPMGQDCMKQYYKAFTKEDICKFIEDVVVNENDPLKEQRECFAQTQLKFNYPNSASIALDYIVEQINSAK